MLCRITQCSAEPQRCSVDLYLRLIFICCHAPGQTLYNAMLENNCSEHASRMSAMENSTKSAGEMLSQLTLSYNRQVFSLALHAVGPLMG
jgi:hypothetical protein